MLDSEDIRDLMELSPMGQGTDGIEDLGFGWMYYSLMRIIKPKRVVEIGSYHGFSTMCMACGIRDNGHGKIWSVDPGQWDSWWRGTDRQAKLTEMFCLGGCWTHFQVKSDRALQLIPGIEHGFDVVLIDGDHTFEGALFDLKNYGEISKWIILHDAHNPNVGGGPGDNVEEALRVWKMGQGEQGHHGWEELSFMGHGTMTILRKKDDD